MKFMMLLSFLFLFGCGANGTKYTDAPQPPPQEQPQDDDTDKVPADEEEDAEELQAIALSAVVKNCSQCHGSQQSPPLNNKGQILGQRERICIRVSSQTMPPGGGLPENEELKILLGLGCE